jgi:predicted TIM-barrel fold metal-dependent hydrolase
VTARGIDVHCHAFNARDLPIAGFVLHVVLEADPFADEQFGALVTFIALLLDSSARGADAELAALEQGHEQPAVVADNAAFRTHARNAAMALQNPTPDPRTMRVIQRVHALLPRAPARLVRQPGDNPTGAAAGTNGTSLPAQQRRAAFLQNLAAMQPGTGVPGFRPRRKGAGPAPRAATQAAIITPDQADSVVNQVADSVAAHAANQSGILYFASLLTKPRAELIRSLVDLPAPADRTQIALFTPALIDFSFWLDDRAGNTSEPDPTSPPPDVTPLEDQIRVMSAISSTAIQRTGNPGIAVHPFVSFCPWRQVAELQAGKTPTQFDLVQDAVRTKGFIGVKLYPLMGFRPTGNTLADSALYPARLRQLGNWADGLNAALDGLYAWCVAEDVPIMAHCSYSQYPSQDAGRLGGPDGWLQVLKNPRFRTLRLNLAHCGGVWDLAAARAATIATLMPPGTPPWPVTVLDALGRPEYPNLYADIADFDDVMQCAAALAPAGAAPPGGDASPITALARLTAQHPPARKRIMYGTDYMFLTQYPNTQTYLANMRDCLAPLLGMKPDDLMGANAARFLGLSDHASQTRRRLDAFRGDTYLSRWE